MYCKPPEVETPKHRDVDHSAGTEEGEMKKRDRLAYVVAGVIAVLLVLMVVLHLTGAVGPGAH